MHMASIQLLAPWSEAYLYSLEIIRVQIILQGGAQFVDYKKIT